MSNVVIDIECDKENDIVKTVINGTGLELVALLCVAIERVPNLKKVIMYVAAHYQQIQDTVLDNEDEESNEFVRQVKDILNNHKPSKN